MNKYNGGKKAAPLVRGTNADRRSPDEIMRSMGFEPSKYMNPLQFLIAVMNDDLDALFKNEKRKTRIAGKGGVAVNYRLAAAQTAARYLHMELPKITVQKDDVGGFGDGLSEAIEMGNDRLRTRRVILEEIERISPDAPLTPANYPAEFEEAVRQIENEIDAEGDTDYDPDAE